MRFCACVLTLTLLQLSSDNFRFKKKISDNIFGYLATFKCYRLFLLFCTVLKGNMKTVLRDCLFTKIPDHISSPCLFGDTFEFLTSSLKIYINICLIACLLFVSFFIFLFCYMALWFYVHSRNSVHKHETVMQLLLLLFLVLIFRIADI